MKFSFTILLLLSMYQLLLAQANSNSRQPDLNRKIRFSSPNFKRSQNPLWVIFSNGKIILQADTSVGGLERSAGKFIKSIAVLKDSVSIINKRYGKLAKQNGVIEIYLDDEKRPNAYAIIECDSINIK